MGRPAMLLGHVTFSLSYVLVVVRSRLHSIGPDYEEAARLGVLFMSYATGAPRPAIRPGRCAPAR